MIASLPMYDRPETAAANDRLWAGLRDAIRDTVPDAPETLTRDGDPWPHWLSPELLFSQTCGLPYRTRLHGRVALIATPDHDIGDPPGHYHSALVVRVADPRESFEDFDGARLAVNDMHSQSGWAAPQQMAREAGFVFADILTSGSHLASAMAVAMKAADIAAIDAVTWKQMQRYDDFTDNLREVARSAPTPALPYITAHEDMAEPLKVGLVQAIAALSTEDRETLCLTGIATISAEDYLAVPSP